MELPRPWAGRLPVDYRFPDNIRFFPISGQSFRFGPKRRNDRTHARDRALYGNRDSGACKVHSDDASGGKGLPHLQAWPLAGEAFLSPLMEIASGGPVSLAREKPGKERGGAPPLHPGAAGAEAKGA